MQTFLRCRRAYQWRYAVGLKKARKSDALRVGNRYHYGLHLLKIGCHPEEVAAEVWRLYDVVPEWVRDLEEWHVEREVAVRTLLAYAHLHQPLGEVLGSEVDWRVKIRNPETGHATGRWRLRGIWDGVVRRPSGQVAVLEHKTTSQAVGPGSDYRRRLRIDSQVSRYLLAAREMGIPADLVLYDITVKPGIKPRKLTKAEVKTLAADGTYLGVAMVDLPADPGSLERETPEMYGTRLTVAICEAPERWFLRLEVPRLDHDLEAEAFDLWHQQQEVSFACRSSRFPRNTEACLSPYRCDFADLCLAGVTPDNLDPGEVPEGYTARSQEDSTHDDPDAAG